MQTIGISIEKAGRTSRHDLLQKTVADRKHARARRRVRLHYPDEVVQCAVWLSCLLGVRKAALAMDLRLSTMYRWFNDHRIRRSQFVLQMVDGENELAADMSHGMIVRCGEKHSVSHPHILSQLRGLSQQNKLAIFDSGDATGKRARALLGNTIAPSNASAGGAAESAATAQSTMPATAASERILAAKALIDRQYWSDWSCEKLANLIGVSRFQFINEFSAAFGKSPYHYLLGVRVYHATQLVNRRSDQTLAEIARSVGFGSSSSMRRAFKNFLGASPANFVNESTSSSPPGFAATSFDAGEADYIGREA